jgi:heat shock protein HtpX
VLTDTTKITIEKGGVLPLAAVNKKSRQRDMGNIMMKVNKYSFINCTCGLKIKIPPEFKKDAVFCPRCGTKHSVVK